MRKFGLKTKIALFAAACGCIGGAAVFLPETSFYERQTANIDFWFHQAALKAGLRLNEIFVRGRNKTSQKEIIDCLAAEQGMPLTAVDLNAARDAIRRLPWVKTVEIERRLPHVLSVNITERKAIAVYQKNKVYRPVDEDGQIIETTVRRLDGLVLLVGEEAPENAPDLLAFLKEEPELFSRVRSAERIGKRRWNIHLDDIEKGIIVRLPETDPAAEWSRLARLNKSQKLLERDITMVDLRQPDKLILRAPKAERKNGKDIPPKGESI